MKYAQGILMLFIILQYGVEAQTTVEISPTTADFEEFCFVPARTPDPYFTLNMNNAYNATWGAVIGEGYNTTGFSENRTAFKFDLSSLPQNIEILQVRLRLIVGLDATRCSGGPYSMTLKVYSFPWYMIRGTNTAEEKWNKVTDSYSKLYQSIPLSLANRTNSPEIIVPYTNPSTDPITDSIRTALSKPNASDRKLGIAFKLDADPQSCFYDVGISSSGYDYPYTQGDLILEVTYKLLNATYLNDFGVTDPVAFLINGNPVTGDFKVTIPGAPTAEAKIDKDRDWWPQNQAGTLQMFYHDDIVYTDNNPYNREPKVWHRDDHQNIYSDDDGTEDATWNGAFVANQNVDNDFTANFYRLVDNGFKLYALETPLGGIEHQIMSVDIGVDEDQNGIPELSSNAPEVLQKRNGPTDNYFDVIVPLYINSGTDRGVFLGWLPNENGSGNTMSGQTTIDYTNNKVTTQIIPDLHHMDDPYNNGYKAKYGQFRALAFENPSATRDITAAINSSTSGILVTGYDATAKVATVTVPKSYVDGYITYYFVGWWDGVYGEENTGGTTVSRHLDLSNISFSAKRYDMVALYKAHLHTGDALAGTKTNSQRKVAIDAQGRHHVAYESAGMVWYTMSADNGATWTPEKKASVGLIQDFTANGLYDGLCRRPSIAVAGEGNIEEVVITYVDEGTEHPGVFVVRPEWNQFVSGYPSESITEPITLEEASGLPSGTCIPVIAINTKSDSKVWMAVWNDGNQLKFSSQSDPGGQNPVILAHKERLYNGLSVNPQYPSIAWVSTETGVNLDYEYHITWRLDKNVKFTLVGIKENTPGVPQIDGNTWSASNGVSIVETIHSSVSTTQVNVPRAIHAPSVTADNAIVADGSRLQNYLVTAAAYEVESQIPTGGGSGGGGTSNFSSAWPTSSYVVSPQRLASTTLRSVFSTTLPASSAPARLRVNERGSKTRSNVSWAWGSKYTLLEYRTTQGTGAPLNPCIGYLETYSGSTKNPVARTLFQDNPIGISVAKRVHPLPQNIYFHTDGVDPNQACVSNSQTIRSVFSQALINSNLDWRIDDSQNSALTKTATILEPIQMKQLTYTDDSSMAVLGICNPRVLNNAGDITPLIWVNAIDEDRQNLQVTIPQRLRTTGFNSAGLTTLYYERELFTEKSEGFGSQEFRIQFRDASTHQVLLTEGIPCAEMPEDSTYYELTGIDIRSLGSRNVYLSIDKSPDMDSAAVEVLHVSANLEIDEELEKLASTAAIPNTVTLDQNYPNPFNPETEITYGLPEPGKVKLCVYDQLGREVRVLIDEFKEAGTYTVQFNAEKLPSGMYLYKIETPYESISRKMMLMK